MFSKDKFESKSRRTDSDENKLKSDMRPTLGSKLSSMLGQWSLGLSRALCSKSDKESCVSSNFCPTILNCFDGNVISFDGNLDFQSNTMG